MKENKAFEEELSGLLEVSSQEKENQSEKKLVNRSNGKKSILKLKLNRLRFSNKQEEKRKYIAHLNDLVKYCERMDGTDKEAPEKKGKYFKASLILRNEIARLEKEDPVTKQ